MRSSLLAALALFLSSEPVHGFGLQKPVNLRTSSTRLHYINDKSHDADVVTLKEINISDKIAQLLEEAPKLKAIPLAQLKPGDRVSGTVVRMLPYGALVQTEYDIPGETPGCVLLHKDRSSFRPKVGQKINNARVAMINHVTKSVTISTMRPNKEPRMPLGALQELDEVQGRVRCVKEYGVFVDVGTKRDALLHWTQIPEDEWESSCLKAGDTVHVQVLNPWRSYDTEKDGGIAVRVMTED